jgi:hypothetical protein
MKLAHETIKQSNRLLVLEILQVERLNWLKTLIIHKNWNSKESQSLQSLELVRVTICQLEKARSLSRVIEILKVNSFLLAEEGD